MESVSLSSEIVVSHLFTKLALLCFSGTIAAAFWVSSWGSSLAGLVFVLLALATVVFEVAVVILSPKTRRNIVIGAAALVLQPALVVLAILSGRQWLAFAVRSRLDEYQVVAERELASLAVSQRRHIEELNPHPDLIRANAYLAPDGGQLVVFNFAHQPRQTLLFSSNRTLPARSDGLCLSSLAPKWFWYRAC